MEKVPLPQPIVLTDEEKEILKEIQFGSSKFFTTINDAPVRLVNSLCRRNAIPSIRVKYLTEAKYRIGRGNGSRWDNFRGNSRDEKINHPHFGPYLWYMLYGPDLPKETIEGFHCIVVNEMGTEIDVMEQLCAFTRAETRKLCLTPSVARDEFFKLAIECKDDLWLAECVRDAAGQASNQLMRKRRY